MVYRRQMLPPVESLQSPYVCGLQTQNWVILSLMTTMTGPYTYWWARFFVCTYPGMRIWTTTTTRWGISTPACATLEGWPALCLKIGRSNTLWRTTILVRPFQISICEGTENAFRLRTKPEIPTRLRKSNLRVRIYKEWYVNHRRLGPSGSIMNQRASTPHIHLHLIIQNTTSFITARGPGPYQLEGARWHLLT